jgi:hypothetical protein
MCTNCLTTFDAVVMQSAGAALLAQNGWARARDVLVGRHPNVRRQHAYDRNAAFLRTLELDPQLVLGARPAVPAAAVAPAAGRASVARRFDRAALRVSSVLPV